ncbi:MAG: hypothetical protein KKF20_06980 [Bacteroidetes bacterium]|nr:hypothetical protein [Bacteroidota bacterium]MBU1423163.1 hypothetical protein [Bacteroidota bacterium]MBU2472136.1 hypothetical protein [Bacteroidota bacterium]MBU2635632.1 hypothetical protein [Bacteroidota bacterium]
MNKWSDITELSYVHGIWVTRKNQLSKSEVDDLIQSARFSASHLTEIAALQLQSPPQGLVEPRKFIMSD